MCTSLINFYLVILLRTLWLVKDFDLDTLLLDIYCDDNVNGIEMKASGYWILGTWPSWYLMP